MLTCIIKTFKLHSKSDKSSCMYFEILLVTIVPPSVRFMYMNCFKQF